MEKKIQLTYIKNNKEYNIKNIILTKEILQTRFAKFIKESERKKGLFLKQDKVYIYQDLNDENIGYRIYDEFANEYFTKTEDALLLSELQKKQPNITLTQFPTALLTLDNRIIGQEMIYYSNRITLYDFMTENEITEDILEQVIDILKELKENNIFYLDNHPKNFMITDNKQLNLIDFDDSQIKLTDNLTNQNLLKESVKWILNYLIQDETINKEKYLKQI